MLRVAAGLGRSGRRSDSRAERGGKPGPLSARARGSLRGNSTGAIHGTGGARRVSFTPSRSVGAVANRCGRAQRSVSAMRHRVAGAGAAVGRRLRMARRELRGDRSRPCAVMDRVCLRAARVGLLLGCVCAAPLVYASPQPPPVSTPPPPQTDVQQPPAVLSQLSVEGATVYSREDVLWLLNLREGTALTQTADEIATSLQGHYERDGYTEARVQGRLEDGH